MCSDRADPGRRPTHWKHRFAWPVIHGLGIRVSVNGLIQEPECLCWFLLFGSGLFTGLRRETKDHVATSRKIIFMVFKGAGGDLCGSVGWWWACFRFWDA